MSFLDEHPDWHKTPKREPYRPLFTLPLFSHPAPKDAGSPTVPPTESVHRGVTPPATPPAAAPMPLEYLKQINQRLAGEQLWYPGTAWSQNRAQEEFAARQRQFMMTPIGYGEARAVGALAGENYNITKHHPVPNPTGWQDPPGQIYERYRGSNLVPINAVRRGGTTGLDPQIAPLVTLNPVDPNNPLQNPTVKSISAPVFDPYRDAMRGIAASSHPLPLVVSSVLRTDVMEAAQRAGGLSAALDMPLDYHSLPKSIFAGGNRPTTVREATQALIQSNIPAFHATAQGLEGRSTRAQYFDAFNQGVVGYLNALDNPPKFLPGEPALAVRAAFQAQKKQQDVEKAARPVGTVGGAWADDLIEEQGSGWNIPTKVENFATAIQKMEPDMREKLYASALYLARQEGIPTAQVLMRMSENYSPNPPKPRDEFVGGTDADLVGRDIAQWEMQTHSPEYEQAHPRVYGTARGAPRVMEKPGRDAQGNVTVEQYTVTPPVTYATTNTVSYPDPDSSVRGTQDVPARHTQMWRSDVRRQAEGVIYNNPIAKQQQFLAGRMASAGKTPRDPYNTFIDTLTTRAKRLINIADFLESDKPYKIAMNFQYGHGKRKGVKANTTLEAVISGERTSTTRWSHEWRKYDDQENLIGGGVSNDVSKLRKDDIVEFYDEKRGGSALARVTADPRHINPQTDEEWEEWSKKEGWSVSAGKKMFASHEEERKNAHLGPPGSQYTEESKIVPGAWQLEYEYLGPGQQQLGSAGARKVAASMRAEAQELQGTADQMRADFPKHLDAADITSAEHGHAVAVSERRAAYREKKKREPSSTDIHIDAMADEERYQNWMRSADAQSVIDEETGGMMPKAQYRQDPIINRRSEMPEGAGGGSRSSRRANREENLSGRSRTPVRAANPPGGSGPSDPFESMDFGGDYRDYEDMRDANSAEAHQASGPTFSQPVPPEAESTRRVKKNSLVSAPTGYGKTSMLITHQTSKGAGFGVILSPLSVLNKQLASRVSDTEFGGEKMQGFWLPGYPGRGGKPSDLKEYQERHDAFYKALGVEFDGRGGHRFTGKGAVAVDRATGKLSWRGAPVTAVMSYEKFAASPGSRLGGVIDDLNKAGLFNAIGVDEAHEISDAGRYMGRQMDLAADTIGSGASRLFVSGSFTSEDISALQQVHGIDPDWTEGEGGTQYITKARNPNVKWRAVDAGDKRGLEDTLALTGDAPAMVFSGHIGAQRGLVDRIKKMGRDVFRFHRSATVDPLSEQEKSTAEAKLERTGGIARNEVGVLSPAAATGLSHQEVANVVQYNPYSERGIIQAAGRLRDPQAGDVDQERYYTMIASERSFRSRAGLVSKTQKRLANMNYLGGLFKSLEAANAAGEFKGTWKEQANQMEEYVQAKLEKEKLHGYSANNAMAYLEESGALSLGRVVDPDTGESDFAWNFQNIGSNAVEAGDWLGNQSIASRTEVDPATRKYKKVSIKSRAISDIDLTRRSEEALGDLWKASMNVSKGVGGGEAGAQAAGDYVRNAMDAWKQRNGGGVSGLEEHIRGIVPRDLSDRLVTAIRDAADEFVKVKQNGGDMNAAQQKFTKAVNQATEFIKGQPDAASAAFQEGANLLTSGRSANGGRGDPTDMLAGQTIMSAARSVPGGVPVEMGGAPPVSGGEGGGNTGGGPSRGIWSGKIGGALYGMYIARRMWQMMAAPVIQDMNQYAQSEATTTPLAYYGASGQMDLSGAGGFAARQSESQYRMGKAAYSVWGPIADFGSTMTANPALNRMWQTGRVVAGAEAASYVLGNTSMMQQLGGYVMGGDQASSMAAGAGKLAPIMAKASQALAGISLGMEGVNAIDAWAEQYTGKKHSILGEEGSLGTFWRFLNRASFAGQHSLDAAIRGGAKAQEATAAYAESHPEYWNWLTSPDTTTDEDERRQEETSQNLSRLSIATGRKREDVAGGYAAYQRILGRSLSGTDVDNLAEMSRKFRTEGITDQAGISAAAGYAEMLGGMIGTTEYEQELNRFAMADQIQQDRMGRAAQRVSGFGSQLSPYMSSVDAIKLARREGFNTQGDVTPYQVLLGLADQAGGLGEEFVTSGGKVYDPTTEVLKRAQGRTGREAQVMATVASAAMDAGVAYNPLNPTVLDLADQYGIRTEQDARAASNQIGLAGQYGTLNEAQVKQILSSTQGFSPMARQSFGNFMAPLFQAGMNTNQVGALMGQFGQQFGAMSPYQQNLMGQVWGGDIGAQNYAAWRQPQMMQQWGYNPGAYRSMDMSGNPIFETNGAAFMSFIQGQAAVGNQAAQGLAGTSSLFMGGMAPQAIASSLGIQPNRMASYMQGGMRAVTNDIRQDMYAAQDAGVGIGFAQIANQRQFLWGSGSWDNPGAGSMWDLENKQRALSYRSTMANFDSQENRMNVNNQFAIRGEALQLERMNTGADYQRFNLDIGRQQQLLSREYQAQTRSLQWQWKQEDYGEEVRFMTGRQRRLAERQMGRDTTMHNLEGEQIEAQQAIEDKRFQKQKEYTEKNIEFDKRQFDLNKEHRETLFKMDQEDFARRKKEYLEQHKLEDQIIALQRKHQKDQLDFQAAQAANSLKQIKLQRELEEATRKNAQAFGDVRGEMEMINRYANVVPVLASVKNMLLTLDNVDAAIVAKIDDLLKKLTSGAYSQNNTSSSTGGGGYTPLIPDDGIDNSMNFVPVNNNKTGDLKVNLVLDGEVFQSFIIDTVNGELVKK